MLLATRVMKRDPSREEIHAEMLLRLAESESLNARLKEQLGLSARPAGIGHNNPPSPIDIDPDIVWRINEFEAASAILKEQPVYPADNGESAKGAVSRIGAVVKWFVDKVASAIVNEAVKAFPWSGFIEKLQALLAAALRFIEGL